MRCAGIRLISHLNILVLFYVCALNSQLASLGVKVNSLHT